MPVLPVLEDHLEVTDPEFASHIDDFRCRPKLLKCIESAPPWGEIESVLMVCSLMSALGRHGMSAEPSCDVGLSDVDTLEFSGDALLSIGIKNDR